MSEVDVSHEVEAAIIRWHNSGFFNKRLERSSVARIEPLEFPVALYTGSITVSTRASVGVLNKPLWNSAQQHYATQRQLYEMQYRQYERDMERFRASKKYFGEPTRPSAPDQPSRLDYLTYHDESWTDTFVHSAEFAAHHKNPRLPYLSQWRAAHFADSQKVRNSGFRAAGADWPDGTDGVRVQKDALASIKSAADRVSRGNVENYEDVQSRVFSYTYSKPDQYTSEGLGTQIVWYRYYQATVTKDGRSRTIAVRLSKSGQWSFFGDVLVDWARVLTALGTFACVSMAFMTFLLVTGDPNYHNNYGGDFKVVDGAAATYGAPSFFADQCHQVELNQVLECADECTTMDTVAGRWVKIDACWANYRHLRKQHGWWMSHLDRLGLLTQTEEEQAEVKKRGVELFLSQVDAARAAGGTELARLAHDGSHEGIMVDRALATELMTAASNATYRATQAKVKAASGLPTRVFLASRAKQLPVPSGTPDMEAVVQQGETAWIVALVDIASAQRDLSPEEATGVFLEAGKVLRTVELPATTTAKLCTTIWARAARGIDSLSQTSDAEAIAAVDNLQRNAASALSVCPGAAKDIDRIRVRAGGEATKEPARLANSSGELGDPAKGGSP